MVYLAETYQRLPNMNFKPKESKSVNKHRRNIPHSRTETTTFAVILLSYIVVLFLLCGNGSAATLHMIVNTIWSMWQSLMKPGLTVAHYLTRAKKRLVMGAKCSGILKVVHFAPIRMHRFTNGKIQKEIVQITALFMPVRLQYLQWESFVVTLVKSCVRRAENRYLEYTLFLLVNSGVSRLGEFCRE